MSDHVPGFGPPARGVPEPAPGPELLPVQRSMRVGPLAGGAAVGVLALVAVAALLPGIGAATLTATPARTPSPTATTSTPVVAAPAPTGPLTLAPLPGVSTASASRATSEPTPTASGTRKPTTTKTSTTATTSTAAPAYPDVRGYRECDRSGAGPYAAVGTGNSSTSCGFAVNVWQAYRAAGINGGSGTVTAASPATGKTYELACSGSQPALCTGGTAGRILIYGGRLVSG